MVLMLIGDVDLEGCHRCHPCRGAVYFESLTGGVASLNHRLQAGKPLASGGGSLAISNWLRCLAWNVNFERVSMLLFAPRTRNVLIRSKYNSSLICVNLRHLRITSLLEIPCSILDIQAELAGVRVLTVQGIRKTLNGGTNQVGLNAQIACCCAKTVLPAVWSLYTKAQVREQ